MHNTQFIYGWSSTPQVPHIPICCRSQTFFKPGTVAHTLNLSTEGRIRWDNYSHLVTQ